MCDSPSALIRMKQWVFDKLQKNASIDTATFTDINRRGSMPGGLPKIVISGTNSKNARTTRSARPNSFKKLRTETSELYDSDRQLCSSTGISITKEHILLSWEELSPEENENRDTFSGNTKSEALQGQGSCSPFKRAWLNHSTQSPLAFQRSQKTRSFPEETQQFTGSSGDLNFSRGNPSSILHMKQPTYSKGIKTLSGQSPSDRIREPHNQARRPTVHEDSLESLGLQPQQQLLSRTWSTCSTRRKAKIRQQTLNYKSQTDLLKKADIGEPTFSGLKSKSATEYERFSSSRVSFKSSDSDIVNLKKREQTLSFRPDNFHCETMKHKSFQSDEDESRRKSLNEIELERRRSSSRKFFCVDKKEDNIEESDTHYDCARFVESVYDNSKGFADVKKHSAEGGTGYLEKVYNGVPIGGLPTMFNLNNAPSEWGSIQMRFQYFSMTKKFQVSLIRGANIGQGVEKVNLFVKVCLLPGKIQQKRGYGIHETVDPVFYETFHFSRLTLGDLCDKLIRVKFYNRQRLCSSSMPLGEAVVSLFNYDLTAETVIWKNLRRCSGQKVSETELIFSC